MTYNHTGTYNYTPTLQSNRGDVQTHDRHKLLYYTPTDVDKVSVTHILFRLKQCAYRWLMLNRGPH